MAEKVNKNELSPEETKKRNRAKSNANLKKYSELTDEEKHEFHSKGGKAAAKARVNKRNSAEAAKLLLSLAVESKTDKAFLKKLGIEEDDMSNSVLLIAKMFQSSCQNGNVKAATLLTDLDMLGESGQRADTSLFEAIANEASGKGGDEDNE